MDTSQNVSTVVSTLTDTLNMVLLALHQTVDTNKLTESQWPPGEDHRVALTTSGATGSRRMP